MADINTTDEFLEDGEINPDYEKPESEGGDVDPSKKIVDEDEIPPVRKSVGEYIIERKEKTIENLKIAEQNKIIEDLRSKTEGGEEEVLTSKAQDMISKEVSDRIKPVIDTIASTTDENELKELFAKEPEAEKFEKQIKAYMKHPVYKGVPPSVIFRNLAFDDAEIMGARKKRIADKEIELSKGGGSGVRPTERNSGDVPSAEDIENMSDEDFKALGNKALSGEFIKK